MMLMAKVSKGLFRFLSGWLRKLTLVVSVIFQQLISITSKSCERSAVGHSER